MNVHRAFAAGMRAVRGFLLQDYPGAVKAYSLRDLVGTDPDVVLVERTGDNAQQAFKAGDLTSAGVEAWVNAAGGTQDGYVRTWYDQSGNGDDAEAPSLLESPKIVNAGALHTHNGLPALLFHGDAYLDTAYEFSQPMSYLVVHKYDDLADTSRTDLFDGAEPPNRNLLDTSNVGYYRMFASFSFTPDTANTAASLNQELVFACFSGVGSKLSVNNGPIETGNPGLDVCRIAIGRNSNPATVKLLDSGYAELLAYPSDIDDDGTLSGIRQNINDYYGLW